MRKLFLISLGTILLMTLAPRLYGDTTYFTSFVANYMFKNNFHEVVHGRFYRSAAMDTDDLAKTIRTQKIKSVIDLRLGKDTVDDKGRTEQHVAESEGATYYHVPIASTIMPQYEQIQKLLHTYDEAELPILVHCTSGAHRTGVASAIWLLDKESSSLSAANAQLSLKYGFLPLERDLRVIAQGKPMIDAILTEYMKTAPDSSLSFRAWLDIVAKSYSAAKTHSTRPAKSEDAH